MYIYSIFLNVFEVVLLFIYLVKNSLIGKLKLLIAHGIGILDVQNCAEHNLAISAVSIVKLALVQTVFFFQKCYQYSGVQIQSERLTCKAQLFCDEKKCYNY